MPNPNIPKPPYEIIEVTADDFDAQVLKSPVPVVVDFWGEHCGPCKMVARVLHELAAEFNEKGEKVRFVKCDVEKSFELATQYRITGIPTLIIFKGGNPVAQAVGARSKDQTREFIKENL